MTRGSQKSRLRRSFERAAQAYDGAAAVQRRMADELVDRLSVVRMQPQRILDAGCGSGYAQQGLRERFPDAELLLPTTFKTGASIGGDD